MTIGGDESVTDLMPWQSTLADAAMQYSLAISGPRQCGKTELALDVARRVAVRGDTVDYVTNYPEQAQEAMLRLLRPLRLDQPEAIARTSTDGEFIVDFTSEGRVQFFPPQYPMPFSTLSRPSEQRDQLICDDRQIAVHYGASTQWRRILRVGVGIASYRLPYVRFGMDPGDDPTDEDVWRRAHPGLGTLVPIERFRQMAAVMTPEVFAGELLNATPGSTVEPNSPTFQS